MGKDKHVVMSVGMGSAECYWVHLALPLPLMGHLLCQRTARDFPPATAVSYSRHYLAD